MDPEIWWPWEGPLDKGKYMHELPHSARTARTQCLIFNRYWFSSELELVILALFHQALSTNYTKTSLSLNQQLRNRHQYNVMHTMKKKVGVEDIFTQKLQHNFVSLQFIFYHLVNCWLICMNSYGVICIFSYNTPQWQLCFRGGPSCLLFWKEKKAHFRMSQMTT